MTKLERAVGLLQIHHSGFSPEEQAEVRKETEEFLETALDPDGEEVAENSAVLAAKDAEIAGLKRALDAAKTQRDIAIHAIWNGYFNLKKCTEAEYIEGLRKDVDGSNAEIDRILKPNLYA